MPIRIEGHLFSLFKDYDQTHLAELTYDGKVSWFDARTRLVLIRPLDILKPIRRGKRRPRRASTKLVFGTVLFGGVEALGTFYAGTDGTAATFKKFLTDFMDPRWQPHVDELREDFRNGLAHGLTVKRGGFEFRQHEPFTVSPAGSIEVDPAFLLRDFKRAYRQYVARLRAEGFASDIGAAFQKRFHDVYEA